MDRKSLAVGKYVSIGGVDFMWQYEKKLEYPVCIKRPDPRMAKLIISQYGGAYQNVRVALLTPPKYAF